MQKIILLVALINFIFIPFSNSQNQPNYFQQKLNTTIKVELDDVNHRLSGTVYMDYYNQSPEVLDTIYFHLWANAYKNKNSAFTQQKIAGKDATFYFADEKEMGGYDSLAFFVNGKLSNWKYTKKNRDIAYLLLDNGLQPGKNINITIPFVLKIPGSFSRFGHEDQSYQITQWYPKPAVYDNQGWHTMPYLDMGEFYSEFGDFDVTITLPANYLIAATGELLTRSELKRIKEREKETILISGSGEIENDANFPPSSTVNKTVRYLAENVHDFAWFADKRYLVKEKMIALNETDSVKGQVFYLPENKNSWKNSMDYLERGLLFYSEKVGRYPYPKVAVVDGALKAGSGMEYPMITVVSADAGEMGLDQVIIHEIGHNWFYGILGFNERRYPWLDEGINSYYDHRYTKNYYTGTEFEHIPPGRLKNLITNDWYATYHAMAQRKAVAQASDLASTEFTMYNYFLGAYQNPAMSFNYLAEYLGVENFDKIMQSFFVKWSFKHPGPEDLRIHFEKESNKDLGWFFEELIGNTRVFDYGIRTVKKTDKGFEIKLRNKTESPIPVQIGGLNKDRLIHNSWVEGFLGDTTINLAIDSIDRFVLDHKNLYSDLDRSDNAHYTTFHLFQRKPTIAFLNILDDPLKAQMGWLPSLGWNKGDGFMAGLMLYNHSLPQNKFKLIVHPLVAFGLDSNKDWLTGMGKITYDWNWDQSLRNIRFSTGIKSFHYRLPNDQRLRYISSFGELKLRFNSSLTDNKYVDLSLALHQIEKERTDLNELGLDGPKGNVLSVSARQYDHNVLMPVNWKTKLEYGDFEDLYFGDHNRYLKIEAELSTHFMYALGKTIDIRLYGGVFPWRNRVKSTVTQEGTLGLIGYASNDYLYQDYFFDRGGQVGFFTNQINLSGGGFKTAVNTAYNLGQSNSYVAALNMKANLPFDIPVLTHVKPFVDLGFYGYLPTLNDEYQNKFLYSAGFMVETMEGVLNIYLPLVNSKEIDNIYQEEGNFFNRFSFSLNLHLFDFTRLLDRDDLLFGQ